jgi:hypothetical protein
VGELMPNKSSVKSQIATLEKRLAKGDLPAREFAEVTRTLAQLTGAIETYKRKPKPQPTSSGHLPQTCFQGIWYVQMIEKMAGIEQHYVGDLTSLIQRLSPLERREFEQQARIVQAMSPEEREAWGDTELTEHPLWTPPVRSVATETKSIVESDEAERARLIALLQVKPEPLPAAESVTAPEPSKATYSADHIGAVLRVRQDFVKYRVATYANGEKLCQ